MRKIGSDNGIRKTIIRTKPQFLESNAPVRRTQSKPCPEFDGNHACAQKPLSIKKASHQRHFYFAV
jgi:hypothetical protein